jgi:hypothetical protein
MKKKEVVKFYNLSDGELVTTVNNKIAFIRRGATEFVGYDSRGASADTSYFTPFKLQINPAPQLSCSNSNK